MAYFAFGWPKALATGAVPESGEVVHVSLGADLLVIVFQGALQIWTGGQHRLKIGELVRSPASLQEEGLHTSAFWCPGRKCLAALTDNNHLVYYGLFSAKEALWRYPDGREVKKVNIYLQNSLHLDYGSPSARTVDLAGDGKSVVVVLASGALQVFSWQGQLRGQYNPFTAALEGSRGRMHRARSAMATAASGALRRASGSSASQGSFAAAILETSAQAAAPASAAATPAAAAGSVSEGAVPGLPNGAAGRASSSQGNGTIEAAADSLGSLFAGGCEPLLESPMQSGDWTPLLPTPSALQEVSVRGVHWAPAARLLAVVLEDGRCALCRTPESGIQPVEQVHFFRWVYTPASPSVGAVAAAINPTSRLLALGLAHGRVAIYSFNSLLSLRRTNTAGATGVGGLSRVSPGGALGSAGGSLHGGSAAAAALAAAAAPDPLRLLSLTDWGYSSTVTGSAAVLQWSPDGRVLAVGYGRRGMAVWTPSGCRLMCSLRQAAPAGAPTTQRDGQQAGQGGQQQQQGTGWPSASSPRGSGGAVSPLAPQVPGSLVSQTSMLNPHTLTGEAGVLEDALTALCWGAQGYQLMVAEAGPPVRVCEQDFARFMAGQHRVASQQAQQGREGGAEEAWPRRGQQGVHALQAADRLLLVTESTPLQNPSLAMPAAAGGAAAEASQRPDLILQHVRVPQQYIEPNYPVLHAAISQDRGDIAVAGTRGLAVYARRAQRWRMFGDVAQERQLRVQRLVWLPGGIVAVCAHWDTKEGGGSPYLLLYPRHHLDNASLLARAQLPQMPAAADCAGSCLLLAFAPLELRVVRVELERAATAGPPAGSGAGGGGDARQPPLTARLTTLRELSIHGLSSPLQEIALVEPEVSLGPATLSGSDAIEAAAAAAATQAAPLLAFASSESEGAEQQQQQKPQQQPQANGVRLQPSPLPAQPGLGLEGMPQLTITTKPPPVHQQKQQRGGSSSVGAPAARRPLDPTHCVLLRAGGIMSLLDMDEGTEQILSDEIECFWLPSNPAPLPPIAAAPPAPAPSHSRSSSGIALPSGPAHSSQASRASLAREDSLASSLAVSTAGLAGALAAAAAAAGSELSGPVSSFGGRESEALSSGAGGSSGGGAGGDLAPRQPHVEMPWWTHGARGMQLWFPSALSDPVSPLGASRQPSGGLLSPTIASAALRGAAAAAANSTDPELEFDREVYPIGVSLAEVSIVGVTQRTIRSGAFPPPAPQSLCFHPLPESQPVLPCLLRRLLQKGKFQDALELAKLHSHGPHFSRSLEWLLFTALEFDSQQQREAAHSSGGGGGGVAQPQPQRPVSGGRPFSPRQPGKAAKRLAQAGPLLMSAAALVQQFPQYAELVVSVARKTDAQLWPSLFAAVGSPAALGEGLRCAGDLQSAACCLLIVDHIEGTAQAHSLALRLIRAGLRGGEYELVADLLRFLVPPGESEALLGTPPQDRPASPSKHTIQQQQQQVEAEAGPQPEDATSTQQGGAGYGSWLWGWFGGGSNSSSSAAAEAAAAGQQVRQQGPASPSRRARQSSDNAGDRPQTPETARGDAELSYTPVMDACRLVSRHAWKLLDSGALRQLVALAAALCALPGGALAGLMSGAAWRDPAQAQQHTTPTAAAVASALFVALNEFPALNSDPDSAAAAISLLTLCCDAGCVNHAAALGLLLGDEEAVAAYRRASPQQAEELAGMLAKDAYLSGFAGLLQHELPLAADKEQQQEADGAGEQDLGGIGGSVSHKAASEEQEGDKVG
ncbi:hypothetical protein N2152v2_004523 [Parachlorella kessleri]